MKKKNSIIGLRYVGMSIAVVFAKMVKVVGLDINRKIELYKSENEPTNERLVMKKLKIVWLDETKLKEAQFTIVVVPTMVLYIHKFIKNTAWSKMLFFLGYSTRNNCVKGI